MTPLNTFTPTRKTDGFHTTRQSPSNIAIVKYWGKKGTQIPANPSVSFTLSVCATTTELLVFPRTDFTSVYSIEVFLDGEKKDSFLPKIEKFFGLIEPYAPYIKDYHFRINTSNNFPHSSGIASSASGMSALALCITDLERQLGFDLTKEQSTQRASFFARLGSGSACRSLEGPLVVWGKHPLIEGSSDEYGIKYPYSIHSAFEDFCDTVLLIERGQKSVSSTVGHSLMKGHPFAEARFAQANDNLSKLIPIFKTGDLKAFGEILESEALSLHAMMLTAKPSFTLFKPNTIKAIELVREFREKEALDLYFTLDAGANVHLLYPCDQKDPIRNFIERKLAPLCSGGLLIHDKAGFGAK